jgi:hypothetical protein
MESIVSLEKPRHRRDSVSLVNKIGRMGWVTIVDCS